MGCTDSRGNRLAGATHCTYVAVLDQLGGDVVVVDTGGGRINALEAAVATGVLIRILTQAGAAIPGVVPAFGRIVSIVAIPWQKKWTKVGIVPTWWRKSATGESIETKGGQADGGGSSRPNKG